MKTYLLPLLSAALLSACQTVPTTSNPSTVDDYAAEGVLADRISYQADRAPAKNLILFIGDGMGISTVTAARIYEGQLKGQSGEENQLSWESFPHTALSKTYNTNQQVPDSAGTATAMYTGVKTRAGVIGIGPDADRGDCTAARENELETFFDAASRAGLKLGLVTSARLTHATPAAAYAHVPERNWEYFGSSLNRDAAGGCSDIASQFVENNQFDVAFGGGRRGFLRDVDTVPGTDGEAGQRMDGLNLVEAWKSKNAGGEVVFDRTSLDAFDTSSGNRVLGLFDASHLQYSLTQTGSDRQPSLAELTAKAIETLSAGDQGFVLMVEGGRIDHGHHDGVAALALADTVAFADAVSVADAMTSDTDTTILVTADHSHVFTMAGYPTRGNPILGLVVGNDRTGNPDDAPYLAEDSKPYTTLGYATGRGAVTGPRPSVTQEEALDPSYQQQALIPLSSETHGGEDVAIYAKGPRSFVVSGVVEQSYVHDVVRYALDLQD